MEPNQIAGIISNWNTIEAEVRSGLHTDFGKAKDIQDILDIIHDLQETANTVSPLRDMFNDHIVDLKNPHEVTVNLAELDLINIMYNLYMMKFGMDMTLSEFGYALVNIKRFATRADVDNNINHDSIVNVDTLDYVIEKHNTNSTAHADLFRHKFPGTPLVSPPTDVFEAISLINNLFTVERSCPMTVHDINGRVQTIPENTLGVDFSYGTPAVPVFGQHRNLILNSAALNDVVLLGGVRNAGADLFIITPKDDQNFLLFQENAVLADHGFNYALPEEVTGVKTYYVCCYPLKRSILAISIIGSETEILGTAIYDCKNIETQYSGNIENVNVTLQDLPNGWYRCCITLDTTGLNITDIQCRIKDSINPDNVFNTPYTGIICNAMGFWQQQMTETALPAPPIFTENEPVTVLGTKITRQFSNFYNPIRGAFVIRYLSPRSELFGIPSALFRLGNNGNMTSVVRASTNPINPKRNRILSYNINNDILEQIDSEPYDPEDPTFVKRVVFTYSLGYHGYGFTDYAPEVFATSIDSVINQVDTSFTSIYNGDPGSGAWILQIPQDIISDNDNDDNLVVGELANTAQYRINLDGNILELGYDSISDTYLEGYLINFRYYSLFASRMNIEFLLDQYIQN